MKILMVNKFLYPKGGAETYVLKLGAYLQSQGHEVQYFGMEGEERCVGNRVNAYAPRLDFHSDNRLELLTYPLRVIYSAEARRKFRLVLEDFKPDAVHLNNFNYHLTPSILVEAEKWRTRASKKCKIIYTAHDYQLICPNHKLRVPGESTNCEKCLGGHFSHCAARRCIHGSAARSLVGTAEACFWHGKKAYSYIDTIVCCSDFMRGKIASDRALAHKTVMLRNFIDDVAHEETPKKDYVLYFGRFAEEKGIGTLLKACRQLPEISFVFAGSGLLDREISGMANVKNVGFKAGPELEKLIKEARFSICPSEWYENCPFSVMESEMYATPVIGANIGGIPELISEGKTGELFESGSAEELKNKISSLWHDRERLYRYSQNCKDLCFDTVEEYSKKLLELYC